MKKVALAGLLVAMTLAVSCSKSPGSSGGGIFGNMTSFGGDMVAYNWNMTLTSMGGLEKYYITVQTGGGSGEAVITASKVAGGVETAIPGAFQVFSDVPFALTTSGPTISFGSTAGLFNMTAGDKWVLMLDSNQAVGFFPTMAITSIAVPKFVSGVAAQACQYGLFNGLPSVNVSLAGANQQFSSAPMQVSANTATLGGNFSETSLLLFGTMYPLVQGAAHVVKAGDQVEVTYDRTLTFDGNAADYFKVLAVSDRRLQTLDYAASNSAGRQTVSRTFTSDGDFIGIQFISGLHGAADSVQLDNFSVKVNGAEVFSDNFDSGSLKPAFPNFMWMPANPPTMIGSAKVCGEPGAYSWCATGGRSYTIYGQGASGGLEFNISDGSIGSSFWDGAFMGMTQNSVMLGTYTGRNYDKTCNEQGAFISLINNSQTSYLAGSWNVNVQAQLKNCDNPADNDTPLAFQVNNVPMAQISTLFGGAFTPPPSPPAPPISDSLGNQVQTGGFIQGNSLMGVLATKVPMTMFYRLSLSGIAGSSATINGQVMGWAAKNPMLLFQTCDVQGTYSLSVAR
jgi:hypothetical protein